MKLQIAVDCADPHLLNRFWSTLLGYEREEHGDFIRGLLARGAVTEEETVEVDGVLSFRSAAACRDTRGGGPRLLFQQVPEAKTVKNRVHLDIHLDPDDEPGASMVERAVALGATRLWDGEQGPSKWVTLADPEGNEFCVSV